MDWALLLAALIYVESGGNAWAYNKHDGAVGCLQIRQICLTEVNRGCGTAYKLEDLMGNEQLSRWVCTEYLKMHKAANYESAARLWCGGPQWRNGLQKTDSYWNKVKARLSQKAMSYENSGFRGWSLGKRIGESS